MRFQLAHKGPAEGPTFDAERGVFVLPTRTTADHLPKLVDREGRPMRFAVGHQRRPARGGLLNDRGQALAWAVVAILGVAGVLSLLQQLGG